MNNLRSAFQQTPRFLFTFAAASAVLASLAVLFTAGATQVSVTNGTETISQLSWLEAQGWWGLAILVIFSALYFGPAYFYSRGRRGMVILFSAASVVLTILAGFSIGIFYYVAALALLLALLLLPFTSNSE
ncbi:MAG: hypothetical protein KIS88_08830 [Anaerolineales bacterium]|nr:hypothetical protein [Anaerolineales bacterium]